KEQGTWRNYTTADVVDHAERLAMGLMQMGIRPGDKVAIASGNRSEWCITDQALLRIGAINVPIYPTSSAEDYAYILNHAGVRASFASNAEQHAKAAAAAASAPGLKHSFTFDRLDGRPHWTMLLTDSPALRAELQRHKAAVKPDGLATIIYTSATTGR